ncbi:hypothetical protein Aperf_G00000006705 [Anoplocephala perfoliata]
MRRDVMCYLFDGVPYFFIYEDKLYPTVFLLSSISSSNIPVVYVGDPLIDRIYEGSEAVPHCAIAPGSINSDASSAHLFSLASFSGSVPDIRISKPLAVCILNTDSKDGCVLHSAKDKLAELCPPHLLPSFGLFEKFSSDSADPKLFLGNSEQNEEGTPEDHVELSGDDLIMFCFLYAIFKLKSSDLPLLVNVFYAKYMKSECPKGHNLDVKRTSYKKVNAFLEKMAEEGFITLETVPTDIVRISSVRKNHPKIKDLLEKFPDLEQLMMGDDDADDSAGSNQKTMPVAVGDFYFGPPKFEEQRIISSKIAPFFASAGYRVGDGISQSEICHFVGSYADSNNLRCCEDRNLINVDKMLTLVCDANLFKEAPESTLANPRFQITFEDLIKSLTKGLKVTHKITYPSESGLSPMYLSSNTLPKIKLYEAMQNGKHVTRIGGLVNYGIDMKAFLKYIQVKFACSATLTEDPRSGNAMVIQAQGSHCIALSKMLTESFNLPKQWIDGYQEPIKKGKRKKR